MKFANVDGQRQVPQPGLSGQCPGCGAAMIAKCGEVRVPHWAHKSRVVCDLWWENETAWHRNWKDQFPAEWQEIIQTAEDGERHIADVKTDLGWVIEFQHSSIKPEERRSRNDFYPKLSWVVDGTRRKRDRPQLIKALETGTPIDQHGMIRRTLTDDYAVLREWAGSKAPIFFDLGDPEVLLLLLPGDARQFACLRPFSRAEFIGLHRGEGPGQVRTFDEFAASLNRFVAEHEASLRAPSVVYRVNPARPRRHFRF
jgi:competence protein CoiA